MKWNGNAAADKHKKVGCVCQKEIDLIYVNAGDIYPIEVKKGIAPTKPTKNFNVLSKYKLNIKPGLIIDNSDRIRPINEKAYTFPIYLL